MRYSLHLLRFAIIIGALVATFAGSAAAQLEQVLHRQNPTRTFGYSSDTAYTTDFGQVTSALTADRFVLNNAGPVCRFSGLAFYGGANEEVDPPPPANEAIRVQFYSESNNVPGDILWEQTFENPTRTWTGGLVSGSPGRKEYQYDLHLSPCFVPQPNVAYWVTFTQIGNPTSRFRWETGIGPAEFAQQFPIGTPWVLVTGPQMAYELRTPEPANAALLAVGMLIAIAIRKA